MVNRLGHYVELSESEKKLLERFEECPEEVRAGDVLFSEGDQIDYLYVVKKGWLTSSAVLSGGERQILRLHFPGDMMGSASVAFTGAIATVTSTTESTVCKFPRENLRDLFENEARLAALLYSIAVLENVDLCDRLKGLGRTSAKSRICSLILSVFAHIRIVQGRELDELEIPLRQRDLADAVGLSEVHVYRTLTDMEDEKLIERSRRRIKILDESRMIEIGHFVDRFSKMDTSWHPR